MSSSAFLSCQYLFFFFFNATATTEIYTLSLHDALPILYACFCIHSADNQQHFCGPDLRSEEHTSELQSRFDLVCRLLLEKKKKNNNNKNSCKTSNTKFKFNTLMN